jgi:tetratricopeptide (TPR) repeat protein
LQFAAACLRRFELEQRHAINPMPLQQIRDAALASQFASKEEQNSWLDRAIGENMKLLHLALVHCQRAVRNGPLQGEGYVYLAELSFLLGSSADAKDAYIDQAYRVRPHSGVVAFARGQERALVNDFEGALKHWHVAFQHDPRIRSLIIEKFAPNMLAEDFLKHFQPGVDGLRQLQRNYVRVGNTADAQAIARQLADKLVEQARSATGSVAAIAWNEAQGMYTFVQDSTTALKCAKHAVKFEPNSVSFRHALGRLLLHNEDYEAATRELQWCLRRKPGDPRLVQLLTAANRGSLEKRSASSTSLSPAGKRFK